MSDFPRISFGMIVLNGQPFLRYNLRALYPFAYQIIVVEGAVVAAAALSTPDGHSTDGTLQELYRFQQEEDPENKLEIVTRDGFWAEKDEQSQAYASRAGGDYLWQVDVDEFYQPQDMAAVCWLLHENPSISAVSFPQLTFWGSVNYVVDGWYLRGGAAQFHRLFRWQAGYRYLTHRPPTVVDERRRDLRKLNWIDSRVMESKGIYLYHYSLLFPRQVRNKSTYYASADWARRPAALDWAEEAFMNLRRPFHVHNVYRYPSWLERARQAPPPQVRLMMTAVRLGEVPELERSTADVERLLSRPWYRFGRTLLKLLAPFAYRVALVRWWLRARVEG